jgi:NTP pyrophosphatase (non-canonical NTP hydrolase)
MEKPKINGILHSDVAGFTETLNDYQRIATKSAIYPGIKSPVGLMYCTLKLNGEAGELAEHVGKAMRDDNFGETDIYKRHHTKIGLTEQRRDLVIKEVGDVLWYLSAICNELGLPLGYVARQNLIKLADRTERDALRGSGDTR